MRESESEYENEIQHKIADSQENRDTDCWVCVRFFPSVCNIEVNIDKTSLTAQAYILYRAVVTW